MTFPKYTSHFLPPLVPGLCPCWVCSSVIRQKLPEAPGEREAPAVPRARPALAAPPPLERVLSGEAGLWGHQGADSWEAARSPRDGPGVSRAFRRPGMGPARSALDVTSFTQQRPSPGGRRVLCVRADSSRRLCCDTALAFALCDFPTPCQELAPAPYPASLPAQPS